jgi:hypothetical protein
LITAAAVLGDNIRNVDAIDKAPASMIRFLGI